jgi:protein-disulfide isomerase
LKDFQYEFPEDVQLVFKQFPLNSIHTEAQIAAEASLAANAQGQFWEFHDLLYANQQALGREDLISYADQLGLDTARFTTDLDNGRWKSAVQADQQDGSRAGVNGTPAIFINGQKYQGPRGFPPEGLEGVARAYLGMGSGN